MASISNDPNGRKRLLVVLPNGDRKQIRLGKMSQKQARTVKLRVESLVGAKASHSSIERETALWLAEIDDTLHAKIADLGLAEPRESRKVRTLAAVIVEFREKRKDAKDSTRANWKQGHDALLTFFGADRDIANLHAGDAEDWRQEQIGLKLADATIRKRTRVVKTLFHWCVRRGYVPSNPFVGLPSTSIAGREKPYVSAGDIHAVIDQLPDIHWKLLVALGRFGGVRVPSEALALRWEHVNWETGRIRVPVPKLAHIAGKGERIIPIFAELRPLLLQAFTEAQEGEHRVVALPAVTTAYLRKVVIQAAQRAGLTPWTSVFHALRASCETDLVQHFPAHIVAAWIGHDLRVAQRHYLQVLDRDFEAAARGDLEGGAKSGAQAAQNRAQQRVASIRDDRKDGGVTPVNTRVSARHGEPIESDCETKKWAILDLNQ